MFSQPQCPAFSVGFYPLFYLIYYFFFVVFSTPMFWNLPEKPGTTQNSFSFTKTFTQSGKVQYADSRFSDTSFGFIDVIEPPNRGGTKTSRICLNSIPISLLLCQSPPILPFNFPPIPSNSPQVLPNPLPHSLQTPPLFSPISPQIPPTSPGPGPGPSSSKSVLERECSSRCFIRQLRDGKCDPKCNNYACAFDGGDCACGNNDFGHQQCSCPVGQARAKDGCEDFSNPTFFFYSFIEKWFNLF